MIKAYNMKSFYKNYNFRKEVGWVYSAYLHTWMCQTDIFVNVFLYLFFFSSPTPQEDLSTSGRNVLLTVQR